MKLKLGRIKIRDIQFGAKSGIDAGVLTINQEEMIGQLADERLENIQIELAHPGESIRIMPVKDVIEPRLKVEGSGGVFPGFMHKVDMVGQGTTVVLDGAAVVTTGKIVGFQEGIIDMTGPGAAYTPFSKTHNVVVKADAVANLSQHEHEAAMRALGLKAATYLAELAWDIEPDSTEEYEHLNFRDNLEKFKGLPRVAYVYMLQTQGLLHDTYVYGVDAKRILPTLMSPTEIMDGAIVSGNCVSACDKNTTYHHLNNPVVHDLLERHGKDINFVGIIITNENVTLADKERSSNFTAKLASMLGLDGAIISEEGFGNPDTDLIMNCTKLEKQGIKTVLITDEYAGRDGASQSLADADPLANAVVTGGNANMVVTLPKLDKVIGDDSPADVIAGGFDGSLADDGTITVEIQAIIGATSELGFNKLSAREI
ncbi:MAG: beta-aspartyl-peptidase [Firmicutes bacterium]|nr:beta-aspartyl-peptidase [Bacillota bacterium]